MIDKLKVIQESFTAVYGPISKAIGDCLMSMDNKKVDATAVISAIIAVAIDISAKANKLAKEQGDTALLVNADHLARFTALLLVNSLQTSSEVRLALDSVITAGIKKNTAPGSDQLN